MYLITIFSILLFIYLNRFSILSFINSHFGSNLTTEESDMSGSTYQNFISKAYNSMINNYYLNKKFKKNISPTQVPIINIEDLTQKKFIKLTNNFTTPLVVKGFVKNSPATQNWSPQYLSENYGSTQLPTIENANIKNNLSSAFSEYNYITVKDAMHNIINGGKMYVNNVSRIFGYHPELLDDLDLDQIKKYSGIDLKNSNNVTHMFIGGKNTGTTLHTSYTGNFFFNVKGQKKWILIDSKYSRYLQPILSKTGLFSVSKIEVFKDDTTINYFPRYEFTLEEGDLLFNPPWWWHAVKNETEYTIGCANRFSSFRVGMKNNPLYTSILLSHPIDNYEYINVGTSKKDANLNFDKILLRDILRQNKKI